MKKAEREIQVLDRVMPLAKDGMNATRDVVLELIRNPLTQMLGVCVAVELLQRVQLDKVPEEWEWVEVDQPGTHAKMWVRRRVKTALLSQALGTTIESVATSAAILQNLGGISGIAGLIGKFVGK